MEYLNNQQSTQTSHLKQMNQITSINTQTNSTLNLSWSTRDSIIQCFNKLSSLLYGKAATDDEKKRLIKELNEINTKLAFLPLKSCEAKTSNHALVDQIDEDSSDLVLDLSQESRIKLIEHLIKNQTYAILYSDTLNGENKTQLVAENNDMIQHLLNLSVRQIDQSDAEKIKDIQKAEEINIANDYRYVTRFEMLEYLDDVEQRCLDEIDERVDILTSLCDECQTNDLTEKLNSLKEEINVKFHKINILRSSTTFHYELDNVKDFFDFNRKVYSNFFYCVGMPWNIGVKVAEKKSPNSENSIKYLGIFVYNHNNTENTNWKLETRVKLTVNNHMTSTRHRTKSFKCVFTDPNNYGLGELIRQEELNDGFIRENKVNLEIFLNCEKLTRINN